MRKDMKKVIISRPRAGGIDRCLRKKINVQDLDENNDIDDGYPTRISVKKDAVGPNGDRKSQTDLLGPLQRYLRKQVGRPWNDVWSEICEHSKDFMGDHLKTHIEWEVEVNCRFDEDELVGPNGYPVGRWRRNGQLYVHPETGILLKAEARDKYRHKKPEYKIVEMDGQEYYQHEGIWYRVKTEPYEPKDAWERHYGSFSSDVFSNGGGSFNGLGYYRSKSLSEAYGKSIRCVWKQQANSKECKRLNGVIERKEAA